MWKNKKRCIMLYDDVHGMWHLPFFRYLCNTLKKEYEVYILLWSDLSPDFFPWAKVVRIQKKSNKELYNLERITQIENILFQVRPNIFFIDFFPFGRYWNILDINLITNFIKKTWWKNISVMRDIYLWKKILTDNGYAKFLDIVHKERGKDLFSVIESDYQWLFDIIFKGSVHHVFLIQSYLSYTVIKHIIDWILVFWDKNIYDISDEFLLSESQKNIFHHLWYIPEANVTKKNNSDSWKSILISTWWNVTSKQDFENLIKYINSLSWYSIRLLLGPYIDRAYKKKIISIVHRNSNITVSGFIPNFNKLLHSSSYFFWFWWYGTFQSLFDYDGQAFIMANYDNKDFRHRYYEQKYRTIHLQDFLNVTFLDNFSPQNLDMCFQQEKKQVQKKKIDFCSSVKLIETVNRIVISKK